MNQGVRFLCVLFCVMSMVTASSRHHRNESLTRGQHEDSSPSGNSPGILILRNESSLLRVKKAIDKSTTGFTESEKKIILDAHNAERRISGASDMMILTWDDALEKFAQAWASKCNFAHQTEAQRTNVGNFPVVGENLAASTDASGYPAGAVSQWNGEKADYTYDTNSCSKTCGHYTADVWATTRSVGCGIKYCDPLQGVAWPGYFVVCSYGPGGNYVGQKPYKKGAACSACPSDAKYCIDGLCSTTQDTQGTTQGTQGTTQGTQRTTQGTQSTTQGSDSSSEMVSISTYLLCGYMVISAVIFQVIV
ncbi:unnamed protein product [Lymnaea stagnalis]|uniref:SCP domain-containing protein n=1 Tax=Lymnaea stagnalis TaxID=6523 RepID=A0AAV2IQ05_LYMST